METNGYNGGHAGPTAFEACSIEGQNFMKLRDLVTSVGRRRIKENVLRKQDDLTTLKNSLHSKKDMLLSLKKRGKLNDREMSLLYPENESTPCVDQFDLTLWKTVCQKVTHSKLKVRWDGTPSALDLSWPHDLIRLCHIRNRLSHVVQTKMAADVPEFVRLQRDVTIVLVRLGEPIENIENNLRLDFGSDDGVAANTEEIQRYMAARMAVEEQNYIRFQSLVTEVGTERLKCYVINELRAQYNTNLYGVLSLTDTCDTIKKLRDEKHVSEEQYDILYPTAHKPFETEIDIALWVVLARNLLTQPTDQPPVRWNAAPTAEQVTWQYDVIRVRDARNYLQHAPHATMATDEFTERWHNMATALIRLGAKQSVVDDYLKRDYSGMTSDVIDVKGVPMKFMSRQQWGARDPKNTLTPFGDKPASHVIISHCVYINPCPHSYQCCMQVLNLQRYHMDETNFDDIAFNYLVGNDGVVYEGRGCDYRGATALNWNSKSFGISFVGKYEQESAQSEAALTAARLLLTHLVERGRLQENFTVYGLRQVRPIHEAPKIELYEQIKTWPEWKEYTEADKPV